MNDQNDKPYRPPPGQYSRELRKAVLDHDLPAVRMLIDLGVDPSHIPSIGTGERLMSAYEVLGDRIARGSNFKSRPNDFLISVQMLEALLAGTRIPLPKDSELLSADASNARRDRRLQPEQFTIVETGRERVRALSKIMTAYQSARETIDYARGFFEEPRLRYTHILPPPDNKNPFTVRSDEYWVKAIADNHMKTVVGELQKLQDASPELYAEVMEDVSIWASREDAAKYAAAVGPAKPRSTPAIPIAKPAWMQKILDPDQENTALYDYIANKKPGGTPSL